VSSLRGAHRDLRTDEMLDAVVSRLRPILVTTLTTLGGVLPMAYGIGGYDVVVAPMSLALGWGLGLSTLVTLVLVPVLYSVSADLRRQPWREWLRHPRRIFARRVVAES
jgi:multidrug efflux pump subunit AcrB